MSKAPTRLQLAQGKAQAAIAKTNEQISVLGEKTGLLYEQLTKLQERFDAIRNIPTEEKLEYEKLKEIRLTWKQQADKIEEDYKEAATINAGAGAAGAGLGVAVVAFGPTAAMGIATTFGVASTGTAISALSGAAATNAALAWLGGGALAAGGGGMVVGNAFLALAGPVGWAIAGLALIGSGLMFWKTSNDKKKLENLFSLISERDIKSYELAIVEIGERILKIQSETKTLIEALEKILSFGLDYSVMTEKQQYELGSYVNLMNASSQLLINPILGLQPKYTEADYDTCFGDKNGDGMKNAVISLANLLYQIDIDEKEQRLLAASLKKNKSFQQSMSVKKRDFDVDVIKKAVIALKIKNA